MLPFCQFSSCIVIYNLHPFYRRFYLYLYFLIQLVQWAILLTEIANKLIMTESFCKGDIFMGSIIYGLLATTLI